MTRSYISYSFSHLGLWSLKIFESNGSLRRNVFKSSHVGEAGIKVMQKIELYLNLRTELPRSVSGNTESVRSWVSYRNPLTLMMIRSHNSWSWSIGSNLTPSGNVVDTCNLEPDKPGIGDIPDDFNPSDLPPVVSIESPPNLGKDLKKNITIIIPIRHKMYMNIYYMWEILGFCDYYQDMNVKMMRKKKMHKLTWSTFIPNTQIMSQHVISFLRLHTSFLRELQNSKT